MGLTRSNSGFSALQVFFSHLCEKEEWGQEKKKKIVGGKKGIEKERKEAIRKEERSEAK